MVVFIITALVLAGVAVAVLFPGPTERAFRVVTTSRKVIGGALGLIGSLFMVSTGIFPLVLLGSATFVYTGVWLVVDDVHEDLLDRVS